MSITIGKLRYEWEADWAKLPPMTGWAHHGLAVSLDGTIFTGHAAEPRILVLDPAGNLVRSFDMPVIENHCITLSRENGCEVLWIVDTGSKSKPVGRGDVQVLKCDTTGKLLKRLTRNDFKVDAESPFCPTALTVDPVSGKVWIADGYGSSRVYRFSAGLELELVLTGEESAAGAFRQPHWIYADTRGATTRIYIADRRNDRVLVYAPDGGFIKEIKEGLVTPSAFCSFDQYLVVAELNARIVILDGYDRYVGAIGEGRRYVGVPGWPNRLDVAGAVIPPQADIAPVTFNSPHGVGCDAAGNIYISEWLLGDRFTRLKRLQ